VSAGAYASRRSPAAAANLNRPPGMCVNRPSDAGWWMRQIAASAIPS